MLCDAHTEANHFWWHPLENTLLYSGLFVMWAAVFRRSLGSAAGHLLPRGLRDAVRAEGPIPGGAGVRGGTDGLRGRNSPSDCGCCCRKCRWDGRAAVWRQVAILESCDILQGEGVRCDLPFGGDILKWIMQTQFPMYNFQTLLES